VFRLTGLSRKSYRLSFSLLSMRMRKRSKSPNIGPCALRGPTVRVFSARILAMMEDRSK